MNGTQAFNVIIPDYPIHYVVAQARKAKKFYLSHAAFNGTANIAAQDPKLPQYVKEGLLSGIYAVRQPKQAGGRPYIIEASTGKVLPANGKTVGKQHTKRINAQEMFVGGMGAAFNRSKMKDQLEAFFKPFILRQLPRTIMAPKGHYIQIELIFYCPLTLWRKQGKSVLDEDNHSFPYTKAFRDALTTGTGVVPADDPNYIRGGYSRQVDIPTEERRLEIRIHFCKNGQPIQYGYTHEVPEPSDDPATGHDPEAPGGPAVPGTVDRY